MEGHSLELEIIAADLTEKDRDMAGSVSADSDVPVSGVSIEFSTAVGRAVRDGASGEELSRLIGMSDVDLARHNAGLETGSETSEPQP